LQRIEADQSPVAEAEAIDWAQWTRERFVFGMRRMVGIDWNQLEIVGEPLSLQAMRPVIDRYIQSGWFIQEESRVRLSKSGLAISDALWPAFFDTPTEGYC
jgi:coproporphyrinogen III oxidase-like Fe-S oxidoreductase